MEHYGDGKKDLHCEFIYLEKAYDIVPRQDLWNCLRFKRVDEKYISLMQEMYEGCKTRVRCTAGETKVVDVAVGLHQGSALTPFLFTVIIDSLRQEMQREAPRNMLFADDVVVCDKSNEKVKESLKSWRAAMEDKGVRVSRQKTEYLRLKVDPDGWRDCKKEDLAAAGVTEEDAVDRRR